MRVDNFYKVTLIIELIHPSAQNTIILLNRINITDSTIHSGKLEHNDRVINNCKVVQVLQVLVTTDGIRF